MVSILKRVAKCQLVKCHSESWENFRGGATIINGKVIVKICGHFFCVSWGDRKKKSGVTARAMTALTVKHLLGSALYANAFGCQMESGDTNCLSPSDMRWCSAYEPILAFLSLSTYFLFQILFLFTPSIPALITHTSFFPPSSPWHVHHFMHCSPTLLLLLLPPPWVECMAYRHRNRQPWQVEIAGSAAMHDSPWDCRMPTL